MKEIRRALVMNHITDEEWIRYRQKRAPELKNKLIEAYVYLVKLVAGRLGIYLNHYVELDDLIGFGTIGLIDAIDKFDPDKNVKFETYASLRIRGAIIDEIRKLDWAPRTLRKKQKELNHVIKTLENTLGRTPSDDEVMAQLGVNEETYLTLLQETHMSALVFIEDYRLQVDNMRDVKEKDPEQEVEKKELTNQLANAIENLPEREKMVISLYYFEEMTLKEISTILEVSESRISQLHTKAVSRLRQRLEKFHFMFPL